MVTVGLIDDQKPDAGDGIGERVGLSEAVELDWADDGDDMPPPEAADLAMIDASVASDFPGGDDEFGIDCGYREDDDEEDDDLIDDEDEFDDDDDFDDFDDDLDDELDDDLDDDDV